MLLGSRLYTLVNGTYFGGSTVGAASANPSRVETRAIALLDHGLGTGFEGRYGADNINGGDGDDVLFGQLGNDFLQGARRHRLHRGQRRRRHRSTAASVRTT